MYIYAADLVGRLRKVWRKTRLYVQEEAIPPLPDEAVLRRLLDVTYHASMLTEEGRRPSFRVVCCRRGEFDDANNGRLRNCRKIAFSTPVPLTEKQLLQLAPATDPTSVLVAVEPAEEPTGELVIRGLLDTGTSWWSHMRRESERLVHAPPDLLTVASARPGQLAISRGWRILLKLENGRLASPPVDVFLNGPVAADFLGPVEQLYHLVYEGFSSDDPYEPPLNHHNCSVRYISYIKRLLTYFMDKPHGGIVLIVPEDVDERFEQLVNIKFACRSYDMWEKLIESLRLRRRWFEVGAEIARGEGVCEKSKVVDLSHLRSAIEEREHELTDALQLMAALSGVDGAVVLTDRLRLIGFGAELRARTPVSVVYKALDSLGEQREQVVPEIFGTRHRSAFRFCAEYGRGTAFVHSQDGGLKAVKKVGDEVVFWDVNPPSD